MIRVDIVESCFGKHNADTKNIIFKDTNYKTIEKEFDLNGLEADKVYILENFNSLRGKYNKLKILLNQYKERHILLNKTTLNKIKLNIALDDLDKVDLSPFDDLQNKIDNLKNKLNSIRDDMKSWQSEKEDEISDFKNSIPDPVKTNTFKNLSVGSVEKEFISYGSNTYIDIPIKNENLIIPILSSDYEFSKIKGISSIYPTDGYWRIYLDGVSKDEANEKIKVDFLILKIQN